MAVQHDRFVAVGPFPAIPAQAGIAPGWRCSRFPNRNIIVRFDPDLVLARRTMAATNTHSAT